MYLYGAGGHAKVIIDILVDSGTELKGIFDDDSSLLDLNGYKVIGQYKGQKLDDSLIISIGDNRIRERIVNQQNTAFGNAIHRSAIISPSAVIDIGTVVMQGAIIQASTYIGAHVIINTRASVDHDCNIKDFAHVSPGAVLCGHVQIGEGTLIGAGAVVLPGVKVGKWCKIGAGAVVTKDVADFSTVITKSVTISR